MTTNPLSTWNGNYMALTRQGNFDDLTNYSIGEKRGGTSKEKKNTVRVV